MIRKRFVFLLSAVCCLLSALGCTLQEAKDAASPTPVVPIMPAAPVAQTAPPTMPAAPLPLTPGGPQPADSNNPGGPLRGGPMMGGPMAGGAGPNAPLTPTAEMDKKIVEAEKGGDKKAVAVAYAARGTFRMNDSAAGARIKYKSALDDYRKALKADPTNAEAKDSKAMIESIYKSMNRPIPGE